MDIAAKTLMDPICSQAGWLDPELVANQSALVFLKTSKRKTEQALLALMSLDSHLIPAAQSPWLAATIEALIYLSHMLPIVYLLLSIFVIHITVDWLQHKYFQHQLRSALARIDDIDDVQAFAQCVALRLTRCYSASIAQLCQVNDAKKLANHASERMIRVLLNNQCQGQDALVKAMCYAVCHNSCQWYQRGIIGQFWQWLQQDTVRLTSQQPISVAEFFNKHCQIC